jgi:histidyl-tRNA synthetase
MGMGDCVLEILLKEKGLLDDRIPKQQPEYFVTFADKIFGSEMYQIVARLRSKGYSANFSYKLGGLSKQLKEAGSQNAKKCVIIGQEYLDDKKLCVKDMATGEQTLVDLDTFWRELK